MFTGLVQRMGTAQLISPSRVQITCPELQPQLAYGDSIAVDGLCLTVVEILPDGFLADVSPETVRRSIWGQGSGQRTVNLEPSLRVGDKLGGHFVSGHIDGVGQLWDQVATNNAWELSFKVPGDIGRYIVPKGSVAVNGVSLTIAEVRQGGCWFSVAVIPQTYRNTNLSLLQVGDPVNVEADMLGKYVEKLLGLGSPESAISLEFLAEHGYV
ncbi:riboflavin synthase [Synechococcus sp. Nb3U1]|uniref:riboflavin synthase n=1 Tax=Synechococcus sp. Nb3U1 TaxID=1914529 RepID=UPI001F29A456|nr:riboflavin synthase [Synechococcus sp. Nb3U1]MCF2972271.1 riboflavin synthase [Synechococcus sp. Nb3U1]